MYLGDIWSGDDMPDMLHLVKRGVSVVFSSVAPDEQLLMEQFRPGEPGAGGGSSRTASAMVKVVPQQGGRLSVTLLDKRAES